MADTWFLVLVAGAFLAGGVIKGTIGLGLPLIVIGIMSTRISVPAALPIAALPILVMNGWQAMQGLSWRIVFDRLLLLNLSAAVGIVFGSMLLFKLDPELVGLIMGVSLIFFVFINLIAFNLRIPREMEPKASLACGLTGGVLFGMTGSLAVPVVPYIQALNLPKDEFVQAVGMVFFLTAVVFVGSLAVQGAYTWTNTGIAVGALVPSAIGMAIGTWLRGKVSEGLFRRLVFLFILAMGLNLVVKALI